MIRIGGIRVTGKIVIFINQNIFKKKQKMNRIFLIAILVISSINLIIGQSFDLGLITGIGISPSNLDSKSEWNENEIHSKFIPIQLEVNYLFNRDKKLNIFIGSGLRFGNNTYFQNIESLKYGHNVNAIKFTQQHLGIPLRVGAEWRLFNSNSIGIQYELIYNLALQKGENILSETDKTAIFGSLKYSYSLTNRTMNFLSNGLSIYLKTQISNNFFLLTSLGLEIRPTSGNYDFMTDQIQSESDLNSGIKTEFHQRYINENEDLKDNMILFKVGIVRAF